MTVVSVLALFVLVLCLNAAPGEVGLWVELVLYGFFTGAIFSLQPTVQVFARLTTDAERLGTRMGMAAPCMSFGLLAAGWGADVGSVDEGIWV